ncbi:copper chaperone PCu(A)C [Streptomyces profundus]|uniref:copper chaperone PCu(A)C n=1 Tax=Streptomyces profundus TaxID=2867410 RepID=UPI001D16DE14|nr:copper chaperone PCu(A)C [Streptomyces sp. MA3_2.13]UED85238.1 copper chaperone PCu(A)C [Streptomyces sp. MA3_2.13]
MRGAKPLAALLLAGALATGCADDDSADSAATEPGVGPRLTVSDAYIPEPVNAEVAGGFLTLRNEGDADDELVGVTSELTETVEIHQTVDNAMRQVEGLPVPAGGTLALERGGDHLMFLDLPEALTEGDTVSIELRFATSAPIAVEVPVEAATHTGE